MKNWRWVVRDRLKPITGYGKHPKKARVYARGSHISRKLALEAAEKHRTSYKQVIEVWSENI